LAYKLDDIAEIAGQFADVGHETQRNLILIAGLPGVGKTTLAKEFVKQTNAVHFEIDEVKRKVVPKELVADTIDPPEYRYQYYSETIRKLPELFSRSQSNMVVIDETFPLQVFRDMWQQAADYLNINLQWIEIVCAEDTVKDRLCAGKDRESHVLGDKAYPMYCMFKEMFEPFECTHEVVDTCKDITPQVERIVGKLSMK
jgi:predicted kinase